MDIADIVSSDYESLTPDTEVSKLVGVFEEQSVRGVAVESDEGFEGVVTRRQLATTQHQPDQKLASIVRNVPQLAPDEEIRKVAQLMIDSDSHFLPVIEGDEMVGAVTSDAILEHVQSYLDAVTVEDAYTEELVSVEPDTKFSKALNVLRENRITHLPVVENNSPVGILSLYDITDVTVRSTSQSQGGDPGGTDPHGGEISSSAARSRRGGYGAREGESQRILDLPVRDMMISPVRTATLNETLDAPTKRMLESKSASLVVVDSNENPVGILTTTDVLDSLTWEAGGNRGVQVYGTEYLDQIDYDWVVNMVDQFDERDGGMSVLDAKIHLHKHDEKRRGTPLILARMRLYTDRGLFMASGEGFGAKQALNEARDVMERRLRDHKTHGQSKKPPSEEHWEKRFGWLLESSDR
ncbi:CBS domain-containing protein [Salinarchaeum sp. IM2453]|uniref:CBS domain-containing protein n=1 Tax=Salinarchaeum sp. IM2453 TaxID=2862870 RepID=UPI001C837469|nr:CBS domain-containing protein [Salinarchaeum sp. IM2453]QZA88676.1 CBS domain-containing protein [Salinarchaeum sp. IM2453]